jgi:opacity protein-like surface antigen
MAADERGFYIGADLGQGSVDIDRAALDDSISDILGDIGIGISGASSEVSESAFTWGLIAGYQILPYLAVEASYVDLGEAEYKVRGTLTDGVTSVDGSVSIKPSAKGPTLSALGILPFSSGFNVFGRVGVFFADVEYDVSATTGEVSDSRTPSQSEENFMWGVGAGYRAGQWTTRLEYQQIMDLGDEDAIGESDADRIVLGAIYQF